MAKSSFWLCDNCGFDNRPHAFRIGKEKQAKCEQCGADAASGHDVPPVPAAVR